MNHLQFNTNPFMNDHDDPGSAPETRIPSTFYSEKTSATSSPKRRLAADPETDFSGNVRSRRAVQKRVVSVPIGDAEGSKMKGEGPPPSDSWAWRKYGQKPIKGSPYPRGYYRCSSSKGCPARKQVERSRVDPTMLVITYACEHNHPWPTSRNPNTNNTTKPPVQEDPAVFANPASIEPVEKFADLEPDLVLQSDDFCWFSDVASSPAKDTTLLESPICAGSDADVASMLFPMREEDESLFADLGELPECSVVFRRGFYEPVREATWCGSTG